MKQLHLKKSCPDSGPNSGTGSSADSGTGSGADSGTGSSADSGTGSGAFVSSTRFRFFPASKK